jgi:hypothetical protein
MNFVSNQLEMSENAACVQYVLIMDNPSPVKQFKEEILPVVS